MSKFEDYDSASRHYDDQRYAMGSDVMAAMVQFHCGKPLKDLHVLDAGCGTGNYAKALIEYGVGHVTLLDASSGMLEKAKEKLSDHIKSGKVKDVVEATMPPLPFPDHSFDAVMFNLVLHHLENDDGNFIAAIDALKEAKRVLKPNGLLVLSTVLPSHIKYVIWYSQIHEGLTERFCKRMPSSDKLQNMFSSAALKCIQKMNILGTLLNDYYNAEGPLDENWRKTVSYWSFATEEEIDYILKFVENLKEKGELNKWVREHDHANTSGFLSIYMCKA